MKRRRHRLEARVLPVMPNPTVAMANEMTGMMPVVLDTNAEIEGFAGLTDGEDEDELRK